MGPRPESRGGSHLRGGRREGDRDPLADLEDPSRIAGQWRQTLRDYAHPRIGRKRVSEVATADVLAILKPIWSSKPAAARAVYQRIGAVMKWAVAKGYRSDNPAGDAIAAALPRNGNATRHHQALPHGEVSAALAKVRDSGSHAGVRLALEFMVLTATRSNEVRGATWDEFDHDVWTIPASRMKAKREHRVPLSRRALEILEEARKRHDDGGIVFRGAKGGGSTPRCSAACSGVSASRERPTG